MTSDNLTPEQRAARDKYLLRTYAISHDEYCALYESQGRACAICRRPLKPGTGVVDHDHRKRGRDSVRGILCGRSPTSCNRMLVYPTDRVSWHLAVAEYLRTPPAQLLLATAPIEEPPHG